MRNEYYKAIAKAIRAQAGHLADFVERNPDRTQKEDLYANIFLCFAGITDAIIHLDMRPSELSDIIGRIFSDATCFEVLAQLESRRLDYKNRPRRDLGLGAPRHNSQPVG